VGHVGAAAGSGGDGARLPVLYNDTPGAGNVFASVHDLALFARFHLDGSAGGGDVGLDGAARARMQANAEPGALHHYYGDAYYGLGWYVRANDGGRRVVWHEGGMPGASSILKLLPDDGLAVVVLANRTDVTAQTQAVADALIAAVLPEWHGAPLDPVAGYAPYAGEAEFDGRWTGTLQVDGEARACTLELAADGGITIRYDAGGDGKLAEASFRAIVDGDSLVGAFPGPLIAADLGDAGPALLLVKLVRSGDRLRGALVAYSSPTRLDYLLPYAVDLHR